MSQEADSTKGKKGGGKKPRRRSARFYINMNNPPSPEALAALTALFPSDPDDDGRVAAPDAVKRDFTQAQRRELARRGHALADGSYPVETAEDLHNAAHLARTGHGDAEAARKLIARRARELGVSDPLEQSEKAMAAGDGYGDHYAQHRVSEPLGAADGHASPSAADHGVGQGRNSNIAAWHRDLRQSTVQVTELASLSTVNGDNQNGDRDITYQPGHALLAMLNARAEAGRYTGMQPVNPDPRRPAGHTAPIGQSNGTHGTGYPVSNSPMSAKAAGPLRGTEALAELKRRMFPGSGGAR